MTMANGNFPLFSQNAKLTHFIEMGIYESLIELIDLFYCCGALKLTVLLTELDIKRFICQFCTARKMLANQNFVNVIFIQFVS